jgi:hypothetical protein
MSEEEHFDDREDILLEETRQRVLDAKPLGKRAALKAAQLARIRALTGEGCIVRVGSLGATVFNSPRTQAHLGMDGANTVRSC